MLDFPESEMDVRERSPLALAFVGDGVLDLLVRSALVAESRQPVGVLHGRAVEMVSARAQFAAMELLAPLLSEQEAAVVRRGRNARKTSAAPNATAEEYRTSTGLEALFGWLYLQNRHRRLHELFVPIWQRYKQGGTAK
jgi:ribonuclease-3 family protein